MKIFAEVTEKIMSMLPEFADKSVLFDHKLCAENGDKNAILFRSDTAYELGGSGKASVSSIVFTDLLPMQDEVILYGPDLSEINSDISTLVKITDVFQVKEICHGMKLAVHFAQLVMIKIS